MTGCYKLVGRDCTADVSGLCAHCRCPISQRSTFREPTRRAIAAVAWTKRESDPRWSTFDLEMQSRASKRNVALNLGPRIAEGLKATRR